MVLEWLPKGMCVLDVFNRLEEVRNPHCSTVYQNHEQPHKYLRDLKCGKIGSLWSTSKAEVATKCKGSELMKLQILCFLCKLRTSKVNYTVSCLEQFSAPRKFCHSNKGDQTSVFQQCTFHNQCLISRKTYMINSFQLDHTKNLSEDSLLFIIL